MAFQNPGLRAIYQNWLQPAWSTIDLDNTSPCQYGYEADHVMDWQPSRPAWFEANNPTGGAAYKTISFTLGSALHVDSIGIINYHSNRHITATGEVALESSLEFQLLYWKSEAVPAEWSRIWPSTSDTWAGLSTDEMEEWGPNIFGYFSQPATARNKWQLRVKIPSSPGGNITNASIGCILLGRNYTFPNNPSIPHDRATTISTLYTGREGGAAQAFIREESRRMVGMDIFLGSESTRSAFERLIAGRTRRTNVTTPAVLKRLDLPTAVILPEMWKTTSSNYGGCVYGALSGITTRSLAGGGATARLELAEMI